MNKHILINGIRMQMLPERALYVPEEQLLVIADWHLGKLQHFRSEGLFTPAMEIYSELSRLEVLIDKLQAQRVIFLGDLFHSRWNSDWDVFKEFANQLAAKGLLLTLTKGNHDILEEKHFSNLSMEVCDQFTISETIVFRHQPMADAPDSWFQVVGHVHPGCRVDLGARQTLNLPCFFLERQRLTLPAFGIYTGLMRIARHAEHRLFPIVHDSVLELR